MAFNSTQTPRRSSRPSSSRCWKGQDRRPRRRGSRSSAGPPTAGTRRRAGGADADAADRPGARRRQGAARRTGDRPGEQPRPALRADHELRRDGGRARPGHCALVATVASWLIIIGYLWFRFKSLTYGLAAVLAVVHDVLITLGAVAVSYWLATDPGGEPVPPDRPVQDRPADGRGVPDPDRVLGQRHDRHLRPYPRDQGEDAVPDGEGRQRRPEPDLKPDDLDVVDGLARGGDPLLLRRRGAARVRLRADGRVPQRHVQHDLHRHADPDRLDRHKKPAGAKAGKELAGAR